MRPTYDQFKPIILEYSFEIHPNLIPNQVIFTILFKPKSLYLTLGLDPAVSISWIGIYYRTTPNLYQKPGLCLWIERGSVDLHWKVFLGLWTLDWAGEH